MLSEIKYSSYYRSLKEILNDQGNDFDRF